MGRIKTTFIKNLGEEIYEKYGEKFTNDFYTNKKILKDIVDLKSKKLMNVLAGYITTLKKRKS